MHPAKSVILFTTASGAGYGLLILFAIFDLMGVIPHDPGVTLVSFTLAISLIVIGLLSSTFHLGHPERAWRALSQWRSSWLSREGVLAIASFGPILFYGYSRLAYSEELPVWYMAAPVATGLAALATVYCTAMIYASLRTIPAWSTPLTPIGYLVLALATGGILIYTISYFFGFQSDPVLMLAGMFLALAMVVKQAYWHTIAKAAPRATAESATGLANAGEKVHLFEAPHDSDNYLMREMGFKVARTHAARLRRLVMLWGFIFPLIGLALAHYGPADTAIIPLVIALFTGTIGIIAERFLFFAEAKHVVTLYYGESAV